MATKKQAIHTRYIQAKINGKKDLNPECRLYSQDPGSISHIIRCTIDKYKAHHGKASSMRLWASTVKNKQKRSISATGQTTQ